MNASIIIKKCVIPIAGYGTRLYPASRSVLKALFPIIDTDGVAKPIIQIILEEVLASGIEEVCLVVQENQKEVIENYFSEKIPLALKENDDLGEIIARITEIGQRVTFAVQDRQEGFGHGVFMARDFIGNEPFIVLVGDHVYISRKDVPCIKQVADVYQEYGRSVTGVEEMAERELYGFGTIGGIRVGEGVYKVSALVEKPEVDYARKHLKIEGLKDGDYLCTFGIDALTPSIFDILGYNIKNEIKNRGEIQLRDAMNELGKSEGMYACIVEGERFDIGTPQEYLKTVVGYGLRGPYGDELKSLRD